MRQRNTHVSVCLNQTGSSLSTKKRPGVRRVRPFGTGILIQRLAIAAISFSRVVSRVPLLPKQKANMWFSLWSPFLAPNGVPSNQRPGNSAARKKRNSDIVVKCRAQRASSGKIDCSSLAPWPILAYWKRTGLGPAALFVAQNPRESNLKVRRIELGCSKLRGSLVQINTTRETAIQKDLADGYKQQVHKHPQQHPHGWWVIVCMYPACPHQISSYLSMAIRRGAAPEHLCSKGPSKWNVSRNLRFSCRNCEAASLGAWCLLILRFFGLPCAPHVARPCAPHVRPPGPLLTGWHSAPRRGRARRRYRRASQRAR